MDDERDPQLNELEQANARLRHSLKQCRDIVSDYRSKLAVNSNEPLQKGAEEREQPSP